MVIDPKLGLVIEWSLKESPENPGLLVFSFDVEDGCLAVHYGKEPFIKGKTYKMAHRLGRDAVDKLIAFLHEHRLAAPVE